VIPQTNAVSAKHIAQVWGAHWIAPFSMPVPANVDVRNFEAAMIEENPGHAGQYTPDHCIEAALPLLRLNATTWSV
jgi:hypothetical protein